MTRPIPESTVEDVRHLKEEGLTNQAAADATGISPSSVGRIVHERVLPVNPARRHKKLDDETVEELVREHQTGELDTYAAATERAIKMLGELVSYSTVRRAMHDIEDDQRREMAHHQLDNSSVSKQDSRGHPHQDMSEPPGHKKLPDETVQELVRERAAHEIGDSYKEAYERANELLEQPVSYSTVRRRVREAEDQ